MTRSRTTRPERAALERRLDVRVLFHLRMVLPAGLTVDDLAARIRKAHGGSPSGVRRDVEATVHRLSTSQNLTRGKGRGERTVWHLRRTCMECPNVLTPDDGPLCARCTKEDR